MSVIMPIENEQQGTLEPSAQQNATEQLKKISSAVQALRDAVILLNADDGLEWWNQAAEDLLLLVMNVLVSTP